MWVAISKMSGELFGNQPVFSEQYQKNVCDCNADNAEHGVQNVGVFRIGIKHSYPMFNTLITNAAAVMPLNFPPKDRTVIPKISMSSIQSAKLLIWSSKKSGSRRTFGTICSSQRHSIRKVSKTIRHK